jgi:tRNA nucleotidyltransferase (CCA-adding enzyme)
VGAELMKTLKYAKKPSLFFRFLGQVGWLPVFFPELHACIGVPQSPNHHPEGDVFAHTMHCIDAPSDWFTRVVMLCHDLGKVETTEITGDVTGKTVRWEASDYWTDDAWKINNTYKISSAGHEEAGVPLAKAMLERIVFGSKELRGQIALLVELHMIRAVISNDNYVKMVRRTLRRLMQAGLTYEDLVKVVHADLCGRPPLPKPLIQKVRGELFVGYASELEDSEEMRPIVTGDMLIELLGEDPENVSKEAGIQIGKMKAKALELQDRGTLNKDNWQERLKQCGFKF